VQRLALGTAQFGLSYGVANRRGQVDQKEGLTIIRRAADAGINTLDTAIAYGNSECKLGKIDVTGWRVVTKLPRIPDEINVSAWVMGQIRDSLNRLRVDSLHGLLLHQSDALLGSRGGDIYAAMVKAKNEGLVAKIGISASGPEDIDAISSQFELDIVQAPLNILDRRLITSGCLERMRKTSIEFHARSIFLQGLLLMDPLLRPARFDRWNVFWNIWHDWLEEARLTPLKACLGFVSSEQNVDRIVVGVDSCAHLVEILEAVNVPQRLIASAELECQDLQLINPAMWSTS